MRPKKKIFLRRSSNRLKGTTWGEAWIYRLGSQLHTEIQLGIEDTIWGKDGTLKEINGCQEEYPLNTEETNPTVQWVS